MKYLLLILLFYFFTPIGLFAQSVYKDNTSVYWQHSLKKGEKLKDIAKLYGISHESIKKVNKLESDNISGIQQLKIPLAVKHLSNEAVKSTYLLHKVKSKESFHQIAYDYDTDISTLKQLNDLSINEIDAGTYLLVPNSFDPVGWNSKNNMMGYFALGFHYSNNWDNEKRMNYSLRARYHLNNKLSWGNIQLRNQFKTSIGYRKELGENLQKYIDRFQLHSYLNYFILDNVSGFLLHSFRSQYLKTYHYKTNGDRIKISSPFAPAYQNISFGISLNSEFYTLSLGILDRRTTYVLDESLFENRTFVYGVERGFNKFTEQGFSLQADVYYTKGRNIKVQSNAYVFIGSEGVVVDMRSDVSFIIHKKIELSLLSEIMYDPRSADFVQFRNEIVTAIRLTKK